MNRSFTIRVFVCRVNNSNFPSIQWKNKDTYFTNMNWINITLTAPKVHNTTLKWEKKHPSRQLLINRTHVCLPCSSVSHKHWSTVWLTKVSGCHLILRKSEEHKIHSDRNRDSKEKWNSGIAQRAWYKHVRGILLQTHTFTQWSTALVRALQGKRRTCLYVSKGKWPYFD